MPRWDAQAEERLRTAAIELFLQLGYENVTVAQIAERSALTPFEALVTALADSGAMLGPQVAPLAVQRREIIARSPELQERGRTKFAAVARALSEELTRRGSEPATAALLADVGVAVFRTGFNRWVDDPDGSDLAACLREAGAELADAVAQL